MILSCKDTDLSLLSISLVNPVLLDWTCPAIVLTSSWADLGLFRKTTLTLIESGNKMLVLHEQVIESRLAFVKLTPTRIWL
jgi:hypothetical protein